MIGWLTNLVRNYPARAASIATALVTVAAVFGLPVTDQQATVFVGAVGAILSALVHHLVTPAPRVPTVGAVPPGFVLTPVGQSTSNASTVTAYPPIEPHLPQPPPQGT